MDKKTKILTISGVLLLIALVLGATYAYFNVQLGNNKSTTVITGSTENILSLGSLSNPTETLKLNLSAINMSKENIGTYYADDEEDYVRTKSEGFHEIGVISVSSNKEVDNNIYRCKADVTVTLDTKEGSMGSLIRGGDLNFFIRWGTHYETLDLSTIKEKGSKTYNIELEIVGNNSKSIKSYVELVNKDADQDYLAGTNLKIDIDTNNLVCTETGDKAVFMMDSTYDGNTANNFMTKIKEENRAFYEEIARLAENIYFVEGIDTEGSIESWDVTNTEKSPAGSILAWVKSESGVYNLYIGSEDKIYAGDLGGLFYGLSDLKRVEFNNLRTDLTTKMNNIFDSLNAQNIKELNVSGFDTSNVTDMSNMFYGLTNLQQLNVSGFDTSKVTDMSNMFRGKMTELNVSNFDTRNVMNMSNMFSGLSNIQKLDVSGFDTSQVVNMSGMFAGMNVQTLDLSHFNTSKVTNMSSMFQGLQVQELDLSHFDTSKVTDMRGMFMGGNLRKLDFRNFDYKDNVAYEAIFMGIPNNITIIVKDAYNKGKVQDLLTASSATGNVLTVSEYELRR